MKKLFIIKKKSSTRSPKKENSPVMLPRSGYEPEFNPKKYNGPLCKRHNCMAYALNIKSENSPQFLQLKSNIANSSFMLNKTSNLKGKSLKTQQCLFTELIFHRMFPNSYRTTADVKCKPGFYKIAILNSPQRKTSGGKHVWHDFHFVRQNSDVLWSHKPGQTAITRVNSNNKPILDPRTAKWSYNNLKYKFCSFFCVPKNFKPIQQNFTPRSI